MAKKEKVTQAVEETEALESTQETTEDSNTNPTPQYKRIVKRITDKDRRIRTVGRIEFIKLVADRANIFQSDMTKILCAMESVVHDLILETDEEHDTEIRILQGLKMNGFYIPSHMSTHPFSKEPIVTQPKIRVHARMSDTYKDQMLVEWRLQQKQKEQTKVEDTTRSWLKGKERK